MTKTVLGWSINTAKKVIPPTLARKYKLEKALDAISRDTHRYSKRKWQCLLVLLRSAVHTIDGAHGMFSRIQHSL